MDRRQIIAFLSAAAIGGRGAGLAQAAGDRKRVGLMIAVTENDPEGLHRVDMFRRGLAETGSIEGRDVVVDVTWYGGSFETAKAAARGYVDRGVDVFVVNGTPGMDAVRALGTTTPIVFVVISNPLGAGYVTSLSRPGANVTGFSTFEPEIAGKWLQLLLEVAPNLKHVSMLLDPKFTGFNSLWKAVEDVAPSQAIVPHAAFASNLEEIDRALEKISEQGAHGLIVSPSPVNTVNRLHLISVANQKGIPAIYPFRFYVRDGALMAYGFNAADQFRRAAGYVNRILRGEKAGDLPVQAPGLFEFGINLHTAAMMGLTVPQSLLVAADEIIE
jgi:putative tryptophan/tyrosine transport system substrate-binding protein